MAGPSPSDPGDTTAPIRVLHVDDEPEFAELTAEFLERADERLSVDTETSASDGLAYLRENDVDCVVSDHDMTGQDGIEFLEAVRERDGELPFILYTGKGSEEVASEAISRGVTDYLQKEGGTDQYTVLANRITNVVDRRRAEQAAERTRTQLEAIGENAVDGIVIIDAESVIRFANPAMEELLGYAPDELEGEPLTTLIPPRHREKHLEAVGRYIETGERTIDWRSVEFHGRHREGHEVPLSVSFGEFEQGGETRFLGIMRDISERVRLEERLREREARFRQLAENIEEIVWMSDPNKSEILYVNPAYEEIWGRSSRSLYEDPGSFVEAIHPDDRDRVRSALETQVTGEYDMEYRIVRPDGETRWVWDRAIPVENDAGEVYRIVGVASDITERKARERELERYENVMEAAGDAVYTLDLDGRFTMLNERFAELTGYSRSELLGSHVSLLLDEADIAEGNRLIRELLTTDAEVAHLEETIYTADDEAVPAEARITLLEDGSGTVVGTTGVTRDVSEQRARERELERYESIFEELNDAIYVLDEDETIVYVNERYASMKGVDREELLGTRITEWADEETVEAAREIRREMRAGERDVGAIEEVFRTVDGERIPVEIRLIDTERAGGLERIGVVRDITERKERERELERTRDLLERTTHIADVGGWEIDPETMEVYWTDHLFDIFGLDRAEAPSLEDALDIYHEADRSTVEDAVRTAIEEGEPFDIEVRFRKPDGGTGWLRVQGTPTVEDGEVTTLRGAVQDITDRKRHERDLERQNARLEEFASVVSHDLRNPLHVAKGRLELAREAVDSDHLEAVEDAHERMETLITDLLSLAREGESVTAPETVALASIVEDCWGNVETAEATLVIETDRGVAADRGRLKQVLENLVRNAVEHGGEDVTITVGDLADGFYIADDGPGIPESDREEVFEVGYSTGETGTGFGLSIVERIVEAHGWDISVTESETGGARFEITGVEFADG
jgi:PAS domain S-box-containing protein